MTEENQGPAAQPPGDNQKPRGTEPAKPADVPQPPQTQTRPRRRHRRLSNVRRLLRALGIIDSLIIVVFAAQAQAPSAANRQQFMRNLVTAAIERTHHQVTYDPGYVVIGYPGATCLPTPASAAMRLFASTGPWASIYRKKCTKTSRAILRPIH